MNQNSQNSFYTNFSPCEISAYTNSQFMNANQNFLTYTTHSSLSYSPDIGQNIPYFYDFSFVEKFHFDINSNILYDTFIYDQNNFY